MDGAIGLDGLAREVRRDLARINVPPAAWTPTPGDELDVLVVGAGQMGLAASFSLKRLGLTRHRVIDGASAGAEGPWVTYARMKTLRSPNHLVGPAQDIPSLTFRAFYEAQHGAAAWESFGKIPNPMWQDYLAFFRDVLELPVESGVRLAAVAPAGDRLEVTLEEPGRRRVERVRRLVLATGRDGLGGVNMPAWVPAGDRRFQHSSEAIDFDALRGRDMAVVGNSASAFDNAAEALEAGARTVHMLMRRPALPTLNRFKGMVHAGFTHGFPTLGDGEKLAMLNAAFSTAVAPPHESVARLATHENFVLHSGRQVQAVQDRGAQVSLDLGEVAITVDKVILGTGFTVDLSMRPELAALHGRVMLWCHREVPRAHLGQFAASPYLDESFAFTPLAPRDDWVRRVHAFNIGAMGSLGLLSGDIPGVGDGALRLGRGVAAGLFREDAAWHLRCIAGYEEPELQGDELEAAEARARALDLSEAS